MAPALTARRVSPAPPRVAIYPTSDEASRAAADSFRRLAAAAIRERGRFMVSLTGGSSPVGVFSRLAATPLREGVEWSAVHLFWGDERCVPPTHPRSNFRLAQHHLLRHLPIPLPNIHRIQGELPPEEGAARYADELARAFGEGTPRFDLVHLGMGDDGHVCSLFPFDPLLHERERTTGVALLRELGEWRVTLTPAVLERARRVEFLVFGGEKRGRVAQVLGGALDPVRIPAQGVRPAEGEVVWWLDAAAGGELDRGNAR